MVYFKHNDKLKRDCEKVKIRFCKKSKLGFENLILSERNKFNMKTSLVILAAGIGSRFGGGVKQIAPVGPGGEIIIDYSIKDALDAGFDKVVFIIRRDIEKDFKEVVGNRVEKLCETEYVYQSVDDLPCETKCSKERTKPWGTTHALWCARKAVKEPFLVINADDYYGKEAYKSAHDFLVSCKSEGEGNLPMGMIGFVLKNTLSDNGGVTRGICETDSNGMLADVKETGSIEKTPTGAAGVFNGKNVDIDLESLVSMNMWCFTPEIFEKAEREFSEFLESLGKEDIKAEHVLPTLVGTLLKNGEISVKVMPSNDTWVGVTYAEDKPYVIDYFKKLIADGVYPEKLY